MRFNRTTLTCGFCGKSFSLKPSAVAHGYGKFCSNPCKYAAAHVPMVDCICKGCGKPFQIYPSNAAQGVGVFCSVACYRLNPKPLATRFWPKVNKDGPLPQSHPEFGNCWLWTAASAGGKWPYGRISSGIPKEAPQQASRVAWELATSTPVPEGAFILHTCDLPACVRNDTTGVYEVNGVSFVRFGHLYLGNADINMKDKMTKGRHIGGRPLGSRLSPEFLHSFRAKRGWT